MEFETGHEPLSAVIDYWLHGNVENGSVPFSWHSVVKILQSKYVGEKGLAEEIRKKYCRHGDSKIERSKLVTSLAIDYNGTYGLSFVYLHLLEDASDKEVL